MEQRWPIILGYMVIGELKEVVWKADIVYLSLFAGRKGGLEGGKDISAMVAHVDLLPTLSALCGIGISDEDKLDGIDFSPVLQHKGKLPQGRTVFIHHPGFQTTV